MSKLCREYLTCIATLNRSTTQQAVAQDSNDKPNKLSN